MKYILFISLSIFSLTDCQSTITKNLAIVCKCDSMETKEEFTQCICESNHRWNTLHDNLVKAQKREDEEEIRKLENQISEEKVCINNGIFIYKDKFKKNFRWKCSKKQLRSR